jgi:phthiocerol/phenolphthiocerol synthesis type-I polyketide synthase E
MVDRDRSLDVAVTGVSARLPGSSHLGQWWDALIAGQVLTTRYDRKQLREAGVPPGLYEDPEYVPVGGHLDDADRFDNTFFRVSARDAEMMDPQHRLMLEVAWTALEDAGAVPGALSTAVFASGSGSPYLRAMLGNGPLDPVDLEQALHGTEPDFIASLISYKLGLTGPAIAVQTACSSGLVAVHLAMQALVNGDCDQAVVVAAGIDFPQAGYLHIRGGIQSASGECRPFDERADGVVAGSGVVAVVLRRFGDAVVDGPQPYGVILGSAVNNDGATKAGYFAPSAIGQEAVIRAALRAADVDAASIGYLEAHATGTRVGDPIEWSAAAAAFGSSGAAPGQIAVGALKANIGHLDAAAGLASLVKALLVVRDGIVPPAAGFARLNPLLETDGSPLYVNTRACAWSGPLPRRAGVSAFGIGGTNAHLVIEEPPPMRRPPTPAGPRLVGLSAADRDALARSAARLADHLDSVGTDLAGVSFTLANGRLDLPERLVVVGTSPAEVAQRLRRGDGVVSGRSPVDRAAPLVFMFPGQGTQYPGMAVPLLHALPGFADALYACLDLLEPPVGDALLDPAFPADRLDSTDLAQPALFAVELAAATALRGLGLDPVAAIGHSLGEVTAACVAGAIDLGDAARFVTARGLAMQACGPGAMLAVGADEQRVRDAVARFGRQVEVAAVNGTDSCVVAGPVDAIADFAVLLGPDVFTKRLRTVRAFHSELIEPAIAPAAEALAGVRLRPTTIPLALTMTGELLPSGTPIGPEFFTGPIRRPVRFADAVRAIGDRYPGAVALEVGPGRVLSALVNGAELTPVALSGGRAGSDGSEVLSALGTLWTMGQPVALASICGDGRLVHLPGYPFAGPTWIAPEARPANHTPAPPAGVPEAVPVRPDEEVPALLAGLWTELLGRTDLSEDSDFFELGGDSLLITSLARKVNQRLGVQVPIRAMLAGRTLGRQTATVLELLATAEAGR